MFSRLKFTLSAGKILSLKKLDSHGPITQAVLNAAASLWKHVTTAMTSSGLGCETQVLLAGWQLLRFHLGEHLLGVLSGH